jgi:hypothetical protein
MRSRQAGITFIGWVVLIIPLAIVVFAGIKVSTLYMNHYKVSKVIEETAKSSSTEATVTALAVRQVIERRFEVEGIETPALDDIQIEKDGDGWVIYTEYNRETELFGNVSLLIHFKKRAVIQ